MIKEYKRMHTAMRISLALIFAGALGNFIDRVALGYVRDMLYFKLIDFPVFNVADSAICIGAAILIIDVLFFKGKTFIDSLDKKKNTDGSEEKE
jgi:signal peptidase II